MRYYNNKRYSSARRSRRLRKMFEKTCPKADYCKNSDRCDYEHSVETEEELWDAVKSDIDENWFSDTKPHYSTDMTNFLQELYYEYYEWLYDCGRSIDMRVYLWAVGYEMAYTQLECEKTDKETE